MITSSTIEVNGFRLAYRQSGQGEPLQAFAWPNEPIAEGEPQPWERDADDLVAFVRALDVGSVHAVGNSSGSTNILCAARREPQLFRTLSLEEPPLITLFYPTLPPTLFDTLSFLFRHPVSFWPVTVYGATTIGPAIKHAKRGDDSRAFTTFGSGCLGKFWTEAMANQDRRRQLEDNAKWLCHFCRYSSLPAYTPQDALDLKLPTLVLTGTEGPSFQRYIDSEFVRLCGSAKKREVRIPGAGHLVHENQPGLVYDEVMKFISEIGAT